MKKMYSTHKQILNEMKRMLSEEDKIRYKDDGESKEMPADSAKKLPNDHPAKKAWLAKQKGDSDDSGEKVKGADLFKSKEGEPKPKSDEPSDSGSDIKDTPELPEKAVDDMLNNTPDKNAEFSEKYGIDVKEFRSMDEGGWGYLEDELIEKGVEANSSFDINTDSEHGDPFNVYVYDDFAVYVDSYTGNFDITTKQDLAAGLKNLSGKKESVRESFLNTTAKLILARRLQ